MISHARKSSSGVLTRVVAILFAVIIILPNPAEAGPFRSGIIGGLGGLAIGGILGGGRGAAVGAIVGGFGGAIVGATSRNRGQRAVHRSYRRSHSRPVRSTPRVAVANPMISGIQGALAAKGYSPGPVDGRMGPATAQAISAYQQASGLLVTGQPSQALLSHMSSATAAKAAPANGNNNTTSQ
jgi:putative peptidoglycan binding protein